MPSLERVRPAMLIDCVWRMVLRLGFRFARAWWYPRRPRHEGALVAIYVWRALLLVKSSYRAEWNFPGGSVRLGETPDAAARREMEEEIGLSSYTLLPAGSACGIWDGRRDRVHFYELHSIAYRSCGLIIVRLSPPIWHRRRNCTASRSQTVATYLGRDLCC
jgi:8-oxo-dGTP pyrophosphatase MutT (NUDIX family)